MENTLEVLTTSKSGREFHRQWPDEVIRDTFVPDIGKCVICDFQLQDNCDVCGAGMDIDDYNPDFEGMCASCAHSLQNA
ncbi:hypothetical protein ACC778_08330 [Rhizobium ruizarguesonis]